MARPAYSYKRMKQGTETALLRAARKIFARHGFDGASVRDITNAAHANLGAITYHFGSKRRLYEQVLESAAGPLAERAVAAAQAGGSATERVRAVVRTYFEYLGSNPDVGQLMLQELVLGRVPPEAAAAPIRTIHNALCHLVEEGQRTGEFRAGDARVLAISIISQPVHMNLIRHALKGFTGIDLGDVATREHIIRETTAFACAGLSISESK